MGAINYLNVSSFDTTLVTSMKNAFYDCWNLTYLNLSSFRTNKVAQMDYMFANCYNLINLDISNFNSFSANTQGIFENVTHLKIITSKDEKICNLKPIGSKCIEN